MEIALKIVSVLALVLVNGFFVASEFALVSVRRSRIESLVAEGQTRARPVLASLQNVTGFIAATQLGITVASLGLGWVGEPAMADILDPLFESVLPANLAFVSAHTVSFLIAFTVITFLTVVFGELVPKSVALQFPEPVAMAFSPVVRLFLTVFRPVIYVMNSAGQAVLRTIGVKAVVGHNLIYTEEELRLIVAASKQGGELWETEEEIIRRAFVFHDFTADDIMVPRTELVGLPIDATLDEVLQTLHTHKFGRYPIYQGDLDDIVGVLYVKDLVTVMLGRRQAGAFTVRALMRPVLTVPTSIPIDAVLDELKARRTHVAIVVDEYGGTAGMVTLDDIVERVVGEVPDEFDLPGEDIAVEPDGSARVDGLTLLADIREHFGLDLDEEVSNTIGGFVFSALGHRPEVGDEVEIENYRLRVEALDGLRIAEVRFSPQDTAAEKQEIGQT
jgi:CBS domain containing-hemolysin-like protein